MMLDARFDDPDILHCLLLGVEAGQSTVKLSQGMKVKQSDLIWQLEEARKGRVPAKREYYRGSSELVSPADAPRAPHTARNEVFLRDWQRHSIMAMLADGGASFPTLTNILDRNGISSPVNDKMATLRLQMQRQGFDYEVLNPNSPRVRYVISGEHAAKALALVSNGWVVA